MTPPADCFVTQVENSVNCQIQIPESAAAHPVADLLRRILLPEPLTRLHIQDVMRHPWFLVRGIFKMHLSIEGFMRHSVS